MRHVRDSWLIGVLDHRTTSPPVLLLICTAISGKVQQPLITSLIRYRAMADELLNCFVLESGCNELVTTAVKLSEMGRNTRKRRRSRKRPITICTANCRYEVVRRVAYRYGMREVSEESPWNLCWTDLSISVERCKDMKRFQVKPKKILK